MGGTARRPAMEVLGLMLVYLQGATPMGGRRRNRPAGEQALRAKSGTAVAAWRIRLGHGHGRTHMKVKAIETLACDAGWRNYHFVKLDDR